MYRWDRITLKEKGKMAMRRNYIPCVLAAFIVSYLSGDIVIQLNISVEEIRNFRITAGFLGILAGLLCAGFLLRLLVLSPLSVGGCRFFVSNSRGQASIGQLLAPFNSGHYGKIVLTLFQRDVSVFLWSLLFIFPGIVKAYEYYIVPYLLAEHPEWSRREILARSREMMQGEKLQTFFLALSFLGWALAGALTWGLVNILYTLPYQRATDAELYLALSEEPQPWGGDASWQQDSHYGGWQS